MMASRVGGGLTYWSMPGNGDMVGPFARMNLEQTTTLS